MGGMGQGREAVPVRGPALHILVMGAAHILKLTHCSGFVQFLHVQIFPGVDGGLHEHVVLAGGLPGLDDGFQFRNGHTHGDGAGRMLACIQRPDGHRRMEGRGDHQMDSVHFRVLQYRIEIGGIVAFVQQVHICQHFQPVRIGVHHDDMLHIGVLQIDGQEAAAETHTHNGYCNFSVFHRYTSFFRF